MEAIKKVIKQINYLEQTTKKYTDNELKQKTIDFKEQLKNGKDVEEIIPEAFAVVREATRRITGKRLYDVQLMGGYILNQGRIAEIKAGEGKTLIQGLPAYLNALEGKGVHVITTNEYLSKRDFNEVGKILEFLGISVGFIHQNMNTRERKQAYQKDVTYGSNTEFGFDYLRDNIAYNSDDVVQRGLNYVIIDEADSILLDEAQTPMIISKKNLKTDPYPYVKANSFVRRLKGITILKEEPKNRRQLEEIEKYDYVEDETYKTVELTQKGIKKAEEEYKIENFYDSKNANIINEIRQALRANVILKKDVDYIVQDDKIQLIDKFTGRIMYGKKYTRGLHEAIEAKEHLTIEESSQLVASITTQNYFKMYKKMSGMTGTAKSSEKEFNEIYKIDVVQIPTNKKSQRVDRKDKVFLTEEEKYNAVIEEIKISKKKGQPVLIGTTSIEKSEILSEKLKKENIEHQVLNAKNHELEAQIVEKAGMPYKVTIATNMAGRGTNILLGGTTENTKERKQEIEAGGLKVIGTEKHESKRIDEQLRGRSGRQGEVGESVFYLSYEDELMKIYAHKKNKEEIRKAQKRAENRNYTIRKRLVQYDEVLNKHRDIIYADRKAILYNDTEKIIEKFVSYFCDKIIKDTTEKAKAFVKEIGKNEKIVISEENIQTVKDKILERYNHKRIEIGQDEFSKKEKRKFLKIIDNNWSDHLEIMEELKENMELRVYGRHDPIEEYQKEGKIELERLVDKIKMNMICQLLFECDYYE